MSVDAIVEQVNELTPEERDDLFRRLEAQYAPADIDPGLARLLDERVAEADANPGKGYTWAEVVANARRPR